MIQLFQNALARVVTNWKRYDHSTSILKELHWLPVEQRIQFKIASITHKTGLTNKPSYFANTIRPQQHFTSARRLPDFFLLTKVSLSFWLRRIFSYAAPTVWNSLPSRLADSEIHFQTNFIYLKMLFAKCLSLPRDTVRLQTTDAHFSILSLRSIILVHYVRTTFITEVALY